MRTALIASLTTLTLAASSGALAADIYRWVDADGNVHYGDRPAGEQSELMDIVSKPTNPARLQAEAQARTEARAAAAEREAILAAQGPTPEELRAEAAERAQKCATYREQLQTFTNSRRLYREDENGERVYLDEDETQTARQRVEDQVAEYCSS